MLGTCRLCTDPASLFEGFPGFGDQANRRRRRSRDRDQGKSSAPQNASLSEDIARPQPAGLSVASSKEDYEPRTDEEVNQLLHEWSGLIHERVHDMFQSPAQLRQVLENLAHYIDRNDDPVNPKDKGKDVLWFGEYTDDPEGREAVICMNRMENGEPKKTLTFVNRVLAYLFTSEESFQKLQLQPRKPFRMRCGNQLCINLFHIKS